MMMMNFLQAYYLHCFLVLTITCQRANGFFVQQPYGLPMASTRFGGTITNSFSANGFLLKSSASSIGGIVLDGRFPQTNSSLNENDRVSSLEEKESTTMTRYPWSELQQWALRADGLQT